MEGSEYRMLLRASIVVIAVLYVGLLIIIWSL